jgi:AmmeMemoRadiSam system protein B
MAAGDSLGVTAKGPIRPASAAAHVTRTGKAKRVDLWYTVIVGSGTVIHGHSGSSRGSGVHSRRLGPPPSGSRAPAAAGRYYPAGKSTLRRVVSELLDTVSVPGGDQLAPAYLVPHAAYQQAGLAAAEVYARLRQHGGEIERVIVLGPRHRVPVTGCVAPNAATWSSPLGRTPIDIPTTRMLASDGHIMLDDEAHQVEHSLEIQLPFLQRAVPHAMILPLLVGPLPAEDIVVMLSALADLPGTVVIVTTDLGDSNTVSRTLLSILEMAPERIGIRDACGVHALRGVIGWANHCGLRAELLARAGEHVACAFFDPVM